MSKKKSYMDISNILTEISLGKIFKFFKSSEYDKLRKIEKDPDLKKKLDTMNDTVSSIEKKMKKVYGVDVTLPKYNTKDWLTKNKKKRK